jgi:hypothetical protein
VHGHRRSLRPLRDLIVGCGLAAAACVHEGPGELAARPPASASLQLTEGGLYRTSIRPRDGSIPLNTMHAWIFHVETLSGEPVLPIRLAVTGGMPQHQHGFATEPRVTEALGNGDFVVDGVKFHMAGDWMFRFELVGPAGPDVAVFHVQVAP